MAQTDKRIAAHFLEDDTYWIELADGWICDGTHAIAESTKREAFARMRDVVPCSCAECDARRATSAARSLRAIPSVRRSQTSRENGKRGGRRRLVHEDKREWVTTRIYASQRGWTVEIDRSITRERTGERWALDYTDDIPQGQDLAAAWNEGMTYADVLVDRRQSGRCLRAGTIVR